MPWQVKSFENVPAFLLAKHNHADSAPYLHSQRPPFDLTDTLFDDKGDAVRAAVGHLGEILSEQLQAALEFLVATLDGQRLQAALMAGQETLRKGNGQH